MENIVEFLVLFDITLFFTVLSFILKVSDLSSFVFKMVFRFLSMLFWIFLGLFYQLTSPLVPVVGYFFYVLSLAFTITLFYESWMMWQMRQRDKWGGEIG